MIPGVYSITSKVNQKIYVGSSYDVLGRCRDHRYKLRKGAHINPHLQAHVNKYGLDDLVFEVMEVEPDPTLRFGLEQLLVTALYGKGCFNIARDVSAPARGRALSADHKAKISAAHKGRRCSPETLERMREAHKDTRPSQKCLDRQREVMVGRVPTPETRAKVSAANKGRVKSPETLERLSKANTGKTRTQETKDRIRDSQLGRVASEETKEKMSISQSIRRAKAREESQ